MIEELRRENQRLRREVQALQVQVIEQRKALAAADQITCFSCMLSLAEGGTSDCSPDEYCGPYREARRDRR